MIISRAERPIHCSVRTYRKFKSGEFNALDLPMKGGRKPNGYQEKRGKQVFRRMIHERNNQYKTFNEEFGHLEGDTIVGAKYKSAVITLVERLSKVIITLKPAGRQVKDIEHTLNHWFQSFPPYLFKTITFDCGKEFSSYKKIFGVVTHLRVTTPNIIEPKIGSTGCHLCFFYFTKKPPKKTIF